MRQVLVLIFCLAALRVSKNRKNKCFHIKKNVFFLVFLYRSGTPKSSRIERKNLKRTHQT